MAIFLSQFPSDIQKLIFGKLDTSATLNLMQVSRRNFRLVFCLEDQSLNLLFASPEDLSQIEINTSTEDLYKFIDQTQALAKVSNIASLAVWLAFEQIHRLKKSVKKSLTDLIEKINKICPEKSFLRPANVLVRFVEVDALKSLCLVASQHTANVIENLCVFIGYRGEEPYCGNKKFSQERKIEVIKKAIEALDCDVFPENKLEKLALLQMIVTTCCKEFKAHSYKVPSTAFIYIACSLLEKERKGNHEELAELVKWIGDNPSVFPQIEEPSKLFERIWGTCNKFFTEDSPERLNSPPTLSLSLATIATQKKVIKGLSKILAHCYDTVYDAGQKTAQEGFVASITDDFLSCIMDKIAPNITSKTLKFYLLEALLRIQRERGKAEKVAFLYEGMVRIVEAISLSGQYKYKYKFLCILAKVSDNDDTAKGYFVRAIEAANEFSIKFSLKISIYIDWRGANGTNLDRVPVPTRGEISQEIWSCILASNLKQETIKKELEMALTNFRNSRKSF